MNYRPICDVWILARPKVGYYGAYPNGFLERARVLVGAAIDEPVLHVCGGKVREYPVRGGFGPNDETLDLDPALEPDYLQDAREPFPVGIESWAGVLIDRPYTDEDADHYTPGRDVLPTANKLVRNALEVLPVGRKVGILDYLFPSPPPKSSKIDSKLIATVGVLMGYNNRMRCFTVFERR